MKVYVATEELWVLGVFTTLELAKARCEQWSPPDECEYDGLSWLRYDGAWQRGVRERGTRTWLVQRVVEADVLDALEGKS